MGGANLPLGTDVASGLFINPADLAKMRQLQIDPINASLYGTGALLSGLSLGSLGVTNLSSFASHLQSTPGQMQGFGDTLFAGFGFPGFAFGILSTSESEAKYNSSGTITTLAHYQLIPSLGTGFRLFDGWVRVGYSLQWVNQASGSQTVSSGAANLAYNEGLAQGAAFSHTLGLALVLPVEMLPSINFVVRNIGDTHYSSTSLIQFTPNSTGAPATELMTGDASFSIQSRLGGGGLLNLVALYKDVQNVSNQPVLAHAALGAEFNYRNKFFLRGGWESGYPSAGLCFRHLGSELSLAWYSVELGPTYMSDRDTRVALQYQIRVF